VVEAFRAEFLGEDSSEADVDADAEAEAA
jgi:hypothetical protein